MSLEEKIKGVFKQVLDIGPEEIKPDEQLDASLGMDSTEMVEIVVALKKEFNVQLADNEIKKTSSFNQVVATLQSKGAS